MLRRRRTSLSETIFHYEARYSVKNSEKAMSSISSFRKGIAFIYAKWSHHGLALALFRFVIYNLWIFIIFL